MTEIEDVTEVIVHIYIISGLKRTGMCKLIDCTNQEQQDKVDNECGKGASNYVIVYLEIIHTMVLKSKSFILWKFFIEKL